VQLGILLPWTPRLVGNLAVQSCSMSSSKPWAAAVAGAAAGALVCAALMRRAEKRTEKASVEVVEKAIRERRSMFLADLNGEAASDEAIERMLEAANWAPTHGQTQPWRFTVFKRSSGQVDEFFKVQLDSSRALLDLGGLSKDEESALKKFVKKQPSKAKEIAKCSHVIAISMKAQANPEKIMPEWEEMAAVSCAVQNAHIIACQLGVACYWTSGGTEGPLKTDEVRTLLQLEAGDKCLGLLMVGQADPETWEKSQGRASRGLMAEKCTWL